MYSPDRLADIWALELFITGGKDYDPCHEDPPRRRRRYTEPELPKPRVPNSLHDCVAYHLNPPMWWLCLIDGEPRTIMNWWELPVSNPARRAHDGHGEARDDEEGR